MSSNLPCDNTPPMSPVLQYECTRVPVTALASCGAILIAAEGPFLRFYHTKDSRYISSKRVFKAQSVHGISVFSEEHDHVTKLVIWGGRLLRALEIGFTAPDQQHDDLDIRLSDVGKAPDWILDLAPRPTILENEFEYQKGTCAAITAHNALLQVTIESRSAERPCSRSPFTISISELTSSSRSILYSAHLFWDSSERVLVAAGTAFGEIMYWSWSDEPDVGSVSRIHRVFLGHEGSIFGVQISKEMPKKCCQQLKRVIASCSDDRTIRIWDVSDVNMKSTMLQDLDEDLDISRTRHTGFSNESFDASSFTSSKCLATGWGHTSRVWTVRFLESAPCKGSLYVLSAGEDATARIWELVPTARDDDLPYKMVQLDCAAHHSGKNIWSTTISYDFAGGQQLVCGAADSKITAHPLIRTSKVAKTRKDGAIAEYTVQDLLLLADFAKQDYDAGELQSTHKSTKKAEFFRSYCFIDESTVLLTTNSGKAVLSSLRSDSATGSISDISESTLIAQPQDLQGYSICTSGFLPGVAFLGGAQGSIYLCRSDPPRLTRMFSATGKIGSLIATKISTSPDKDIVALLVTLVGQKEAQLLYINIMHDADVFHVTSVPISDGLTGSMITSMTVVTTPSSDYLLLGFRRGSIAAYRLGPFDTSPSEQATLFRVIESAHGVETVTCLAWMASSPNASHGQILSVGRDGRLAVHWVDLSANTLHLVHNFTLPIGPNVEGLYFHQNSLLVHGFSSKKWVLYDVTKEEEVMGVETGGGHRSWAFQPHSDSYGGTLVWTRTSNMRICSQRGANHVLIRSGGHGREIKAVAVSPRSSQVSSRSFIATGAEDTDIKIFEYLEGHFICRRTIRKHTTGIQHLQWSDDGAYLFSSGGCEEFYIWRVRELPLLDVGIVCEHVYTPESEHSDLRIMSFDVTKQGSKYIIVMAFSDSSLKLYDYAPEAAVKWRSLGKGTYFTSCLTQCVFLSQQRILTAGTDGHAVTWPLSSDTSGPTQKFMGSNMPLVWQHPARIHQNSSKTMVSHVFANDLKLIVSGGDDGSLTFLMVRTKSEHPLASPPTIVKRAHASAVTSCAVLACHSRVMILSSGNDEWVRLWEVVLPNQEVVEQGNELVVYRHKKIKTNVADVSSMAVLSTENMDDGVRVLLCGVGMEVIRVQWGSEILIDNS